MVALLDRGRPSPQGARDFRLLRFPRVEDGTHRESSIESAITLMSEVNPLFFSLITGGTPLTRGDGSVIQTEYNGRGPNARIIWGAHHLYLDRSLELELLNAEVEVLEDGGALEPWKTRIAVVKLPIEFPSDKGNITGFRFSGGTCEPLLDISEPKSEVVSLKTLPHGDLPFLYQG